MRSRMMGRSRFRTCLTRARWILCAATVVSAVCSFTAFSAVAAQNRVLASCYPQAFLPEVNYPDSWADGYVGCDAGAPSYYYTIKLINRAGGDLAVSSGGPITGYSFPYTAIVSCAGAYIRSFLYINVGGQGKSHTSPEASGCAY